MSDLSISRPAERLTALDVMRGIAVCGILLVNVPGMGQTFMLFRPPLPAMLGSADWQSFIVSELFIKGAMRGLFTLLFGASLILMTRGAPDKADPLRAADIYLRRSLGLMALGLVNVLVLLWPGDILFTYGVCGLLLFTFRKASPTVLASMAAALLMGVTATQALSAYGHARSEAEIRLQTDSPSAAPRPAPAAGAALHVQPISTADPASAEMAAETSQRHGGWVSLVTWSGRAWGGDTLGRQGVMVIAESLAFMMLGMLL
ncbi:MAG TPA: DUF418 domain-containing protein, partial [Phenylobacterium sp.]|nr:DUF418 domain-containing protein [Phenylobacterium sp.]